MGWDVDGVGVLIRCLQTLKKNNNDAVMTCMSIRKSHDHASYAIRK